MALDGARTAPPARALLPRPPTSIERTIEQVDAWLGSPGLVLLQEAPTCWTTLREALLTGRISGPLVHDARVAALCVRHGVREVWTADRVFSRFPGLKTRNPLIG